MPAHPLNRRQFVGLTASAVMGSGFARSTSLPAGAAQGWDPYARPVVTGKPLKLQPVFMYSLPVKREEASWKSWGGIQTESAVSEELGRINGELKDLGAAAAFPLQISSPIKVQSVEQALNAARNESDVVLVYACTGRGELLRACLSGGNNALIFARHRSGPVYYWYEALSVAYLGKEEGVRPSEQQPTQEKPHVGDVVVDDYSEILWRLRALYGVRNFLGTRIVALGGTWGKYSPEAPDHARAKFRLEIVDVSYDDLARRIKSAQSDSLLLSQAAQWTNRYLSIPRTRLETEKSFVVNAFLLYRIFGELMAENQATAFTVKNCMGTIIPMSKTTACLALSLLNDEGWLAFCESDFVIIPPGILLHHISGTPVFLHNSTFPHQGLVTCAHCTAPRRMDGKNYNPVRVMSHYESEYGAAPKVDIPVGQAVTFLNPEYSTDRWLGFRGRVVGNPFYAICRSQQDVEIQGDWKKLIREVRDSHWVMVYGDRLKEAGYAARKLGVRWENISETQGDGNAN